MQNILVALEDKLLGRQSEMMHYRHVITSPNTDDFRKRSCAITRLDSAKQPISSHTKTID